MQGNVDVGFQEIFVGRAVECAIRTDDPMVSRRHARIFVQDGRHVIEDLGSANGVFVGDVRTQMHALSNGDTVRCGNLTLNYQTDGMIASPGMGGGFGGAATAMAPGLGMGGPPPGFGAPGGFGGGPPGGGFGGVPQGGFGGPPPPMGGGGFGGPPPAMGGGGGFGGPPPAYGGGPPASMPNMGAPPPPSSGPAIPDYSQAEFQRMQRRIDQLQSEVRLVRGGGEQALRMEELENKVSRLDRDNQELVQKNMVLQAKAAAGGGGGPMRLNTQALVLSRSEEVVNGLNDVLSELRINVLAAEGEVENWAHTLPKASFELVRESLRSCRAQMESAKDLMRLLRDQR